MYRVVDCILDHEKKEAYQLLLDQGLSIDENVSHTILVFDDDVLAATGSLYENVIKMIAVNPKYQGENLTPYVVSILISKLNDMGIFKYFLFTSLEQQRYFSHMNFSKIIETDEVVMFENNVDTITEALTKLNQTLPKLEGVIGSIVMNCNPVTLGHLYLIETARRMVDHLIIFLVLENKSVFSYETRLNLLKSSTSHLDHIYILPSTVYMISSLTFPTYFLKELSSKSKQHMILDIKIFKTYFMKIFNISKRFTGDEPLDPMTNEYNETMKDILKDAWISIERLSKDGKIISASLVRRLAKEKNFEDIKTLVPNATYEFLISKEGQELFLT